MTHAVIGHNQPPAFDFFAFFDRIVSVADMSSAERLVQIIIARQSHAVAGAAVTPKRADLARQASCSEATLKRSYRLLEAFFEVNKRPGKTTEYTPKASVTQDQIELAIRGMPALKGAHCEPPTPTLGEPGSPRAGAHGVGVVVSRGSPSEGHGEPGSYTKGAHQVQGSKENSPHTPLKENNNIYNKPLPLDTARESGGGSEISGLNGATNLIISKLAGWINPIMPDTQTARSSVENFVSLYGSDVVRDSFAELEAKFLHGDIVARPIPYLANACQRRKSKAEIPKKSVENETFWEQQDRMRANLLAARERREREQQNG